MRLNQIALSRFPFGETTVNTVVSPEGHVAEPVGGLARAVSQQGIWVNRPQRSMHCDLHRVDSNRVQYHRNRRSIMSSDVLVSNLEKVGWKDFAPGEFLKVDFDNIGKARIAKNNWFVLLKSVPVLDMVAIETWNSTYKDFLKRARSGLFSSGKYFILILLVDTIGADALDWLSQENKLGFLEAPETITNGGGYTLMLVKDRKRVFAPRTVKLWDVLRATEFTNRTNQALGNYRNSLAGSG
jgi:hypothetical protein